MPDAPNLHLFHRRELLATGALVTAGSMLFDAASASAPPKAVGAKSRAAPRPSPGHVSVPDFRKPGDPDDSPALERAIATGRPVYLPKHQGSRTDGSYAAHRIALRPFTHISGDGPETIIRPTAINTPAVFACMAVSETASVPGITLRDLKFVGHVAAAGFSEHLHLVNLSGVRGLRIEYVTFSGFRGDGLMLGAEFADTAVRQPRFNDDVIIANCHFDGINRQNRNGISIIGGTRITIDRCSFQRCTQPAMPGPIDFEPDNFPFYRLDRLVVTRCHFVDCGGNLAQISVHVPDAVEHIPVGIRVTDNVFTGYRGSGAAVHLSINRAVTTRTPDMQVVIANNRGTGGSSGIRIYSGRGVRIFNNRWTEYSASGFLGYVGTLHTVQDVSVSDQFDRCGGQSGQAFSFYNARNVLFARNVFRHCGNRNPGAACLYFGPGQTHNISLVDNSFAENPMLSTAILRDPTHVSLQERRRGNEFGTLSEGT
jgi:hypothetical protein